MSAFDNGAVFLLVEQYAAAERCFREVTKEFPGCYEAWANLGYALLMQYCDVLEPEDLRNYGVGQIMVGGFYRRPQSLEEQVRGIDEKLWWEATGALREALRLKPDLTLAKANLGVAYLVHPAGKNVGLGEATRCLQEAVPAADSDKTLDPIARAAVLINAGVADLARGDSVDCAIKLKKAAEEAGSRFAGRRRELHNNFRVSNVLDYNRALLLLRSAEKQKRLEAVRLLERYLQSTSQACVWWTLAYDLYEQLCKDLQISYKFRQELRDTSKITFRPLTSVELSSDTITLAEPLSEAKQRLGESLSVPVVAHTNLVRLRYPRYGIDLLGSDRVLAICLSGVESPAITLRISGQGAATKGSVRVGITKQQLEQVLGEEDYDFRQLVNPDIYYRFYRDLGLAVRIRQDKVEELIVVQIPEHTMLGTQ